MTITTSALAEMATTAYKRPQQPIVVELFSNELYIFVSKMKLRLHVEPVDVMKGLDGRERERVRYVGYLLRKINKHKNEVLAVFIEYRIRLVELLTFLLFFAE